MQMTLPIKVPFIIHGRGALGHLKNFKEKRVLIITDKVGRQIFGDKLTALLGDREVMFFDAVEPNPKLGIMNQAGDLAKSFKPELIIGIGGGSALDTAKGAYFLYGQPTMKLTEVQYFVDYGLASRSKLTLIPTTSGTGSESSAGCVFTVESTGMKVDVLSADFIPGVIIIDPELTLSMPRSLTVASGVDALAQAIESSSSIYINDFLFAFNLKAIKTLFQYLPKAAGDGAADIAVREKVHYAASMIGIAMGSASLTIGHACGHAVGALFPYPHGITVAAMLPYCIEYNRAERKAVYTEILEALNIVGEADPAAKLAALVRDFLTGLKVPITYRDMGISEADWKASFETMVKFVAADTCMRTTPRPAGEEEIRKMLQYAYDGKPIDF